MPSSPISPQRLLRGEQGAQYSLPYPAEAEISPNDGQNDRALNAVPVPFNEEVEAPRDSGIQKPRAPKGKNGKRKPPAKVLVPPDAKLLIGREEAAVRLSLSVRSIDYLLADRQLKFRRIGGRVLIPIAELERFARMDHPQRIAG